MINLVIFSSSSYPLCLLSTFLQDSRFKIILLITRTDKPLGRKKIMTANPVKIWGEENKINTLAISNFNPENISQILQIFNKYKPYLNLVANFGLKIPQEIFTFPKKETINIHFSLLPKYRGGAPLEHTLINGDAETGISILKLTKKFDEGDIIYQEKIPLLGTETVDYLYHLLFKKTCSFLPDLLIDFLSGKIVPTPQNNSLATSAYIKNLGDGKINWQKSPEELERYIRALNPNPGTYSYIKINNQLKRLKIIKAHLDKKILILDEVQLEGKNRIPFSEFIKSHPEIKIF